MKVCNRNPKGLCQSGSQLVSPIASPYTGSTGNLLLASSNVTKLEYCISLSPDGKLSGG